MNHITLVGRLTQDLELRCTSNGKDICNYQLAVRRDKDNTDFINITTFGEYAKTLSQYCHKGDMIGVEGKLQISSYEKEGKKYNTYSVITDKIDFLQIKKENTPSTQSIKQDEIDVTDMLPF